MGAAVNQWQTISGTLSELMRVCYFNQKILYDSGVIVAKEKDEEQVENGGR